MSLPIGKYILNIEIDSDNKLLVGDSVPLIDKDGELIADNPTSVETLTNAIQRVPPTSPLLPPSYPPLLPQPPLTSVDERNKDTFSEAFSGLKGKFIKKGGSRKRKTTFRKNTKNRASRKNKNVNMGKNKL